MDALDPGGALRLRPEAEPLDQVEHEIRRTAGETPQPLAALVAERGLDCVGIVFEARDELAAIAAGGAIAGRLRFEDDDVAAGLGDMERRREAEIAGADDQDFGGRARRRAARRSGAGTAVSSQRLARRVMLNSSAG